MLKDEKTMTSDDPSILESKYIISIIQVDGGKTIRRKWPKEKETMVVGRGDDCDIVVKDKKVSQEHLSIQDLSEGRFLVKDLDSTNGIRYKGEEIEKQEISLNQKVQFSNFLLKVTDLQWSELDEEDLEQKPF